VINNFPHGIGVQGPRFRSTGSSSRSIRNRILHIVSTVLGLLLLKLDAILRIMGIEGMLVIGKRR
jgi:hypothetical protein